MKKKVVNEFARRIKAGWGGYRPTNFKTKVFRAVNRKPRRVIQYMNEGLPDVKTESGYSRRIKGIRKVPFHPRNGLPLFSPIWDAHRRGLTPAGRRAQTRSNWNPFRRERRR